MTTFLEHEAVRLAKQLEAMALDVWYEGRTAEREVLAALRTIDTAEERKQWLAMVAGPKLKLRVLVQALKQLVYDDLFRCRNGAALRLEQTFKRTRKKLLDLEKRYARVYDKARPA